MKFIFEMLAFLKLLPKQLRRLGLFLMLFLLLLTGPVLAQTRLTPAWFTNITLPASIAATGNSNVASGTLASQPIIVNPGYGAGFSASWTNIGSGAATTNLGFFINITPDGTNWLVPAPYYFELKHPTGVPALTGTNMPAAWFDGFMQWRVDAVSNCDNANVISNRTTIPSRRRLDYQ